MPDPSKLPPDFFDTMQSSGSALVSITYGGKDGIMHESALVSCDNPYMLLTQILDMLKCDAVVVREPYVVIPRT